MFLFVCILSNSKISYAYFIKDKLCFYHTLKNTNSVNVYHNKFVIIY